MKKKTMGIKLLGFLQLPGEGEGAEVTLPIKDMSKYVARYVPVVSTFPDRPESFWLRIATPKEEESYQKMSNRIVELYCNLFLNNEAPIDDEMEEIADFEFAAITDFQNGSLTLDAVIKAKKSIIEANGNLGIVCNEDNVFFRAFVKNWGAETGTEVSLWDTGETMNVDPFNVLPIHSDLMKYPPFAFSCHLIGVRPMEDAWPNEALQFFRNELRQGSHWHMNLFPPERDSYNGQHPVVIGQSGNKPLILGEELMKFRLAVATEIEKEDDSSDSWDPAREHFEDEMNQANIDWDDPGVRLFGYASKDESVICPQFGRTGRCVKGETCRKEHILVDPTKFSSMPQMVYTTAFEELMELQIGIVYEPLFMKLAIGELHVVLRQDLDAHPGFCQFCQNVNKKEAVAKFQPMVVPPGVGEVVLLKDCGWERAQCIESEQDEDTYKCIKLDSGGEVPCRLPQMRQMPSWCLQLPFFMRRVKLLDFNINYDAQVELTNLIDGKFKLRAVGRGGDFDIVSVLSSTDIDLTNYLVNWEMGKRCQMVVPVGDFPPG